MAAGAFQLWPVNRDGDLIGYRPGPAVPEATALANGAPPAGPAVPAAPAGARAPADGAPPPTAGTSQSGAGTLTAPDPSHRDAFDIYFGVKMGMSPPKDQMDLQDKVQRVLRTVQVLYAKNNAESDRNTRQFRNYYVRLYRLAQLGLEGDNVSPDIATAALATTTSDLIDDEASNVKGTHLRILGCNAAIASAGCLGVYLLMRLTSCYWALLDHFLGEMGLDTPLLANFMLLLIGCFLGVWLSYGIRTTTFGLSDLTVTDADRLTPVIRLFFAGSLTLILGIIFTIPLVEVTIGKTSVTNIATYPMLAFVVGCFCGVSELALPAAVAKRASDFIQSIK